MRLIQLPEGVKLPDEVLSHINDKAMSAPKDVRIEYCQLLISNWLKLNHEDKFLKGLNAPIEISEELEKYLESKIQ
jgi:hypothetical protein